jgi:hypothetical protein
MLLGSDDPYLRKSNDAGFSGRSSSGARREGSVAQVPNLTVSLPTAGG